jgi:hypothetical protein
MLLKNTYRPGWRRKSFSTSWWGWEFQISEKLRLESRVRYPAPYRAGFHLNSLTRSWKLRDYSPASRLASWHRLIEREQRLVPINAGHGGRHRAKGQRPARLARAGPASSPRTGLPANNTVCAAFPAQCPSSASSAHNDSARFFGHPTVEGLAISRYRRDCYPFIDC